MAGILEAEIPTPDLVVYLQASADVLQRRIARRGRPFEFNMDPAYIESLNAAYNHFFFHYDKSPLLVVNTDEIDYVENPRDREEIITEILKARGGVTYYQPPRSRDKLFIRDHRPSAQ